MFFFFVIIVIVVVIIITTTIITMIINNTITINIIIIVVIIFSLPPSVGILSAEAPCQQVLEQSKAALPLPAKYTQRVPRLECRRMLHCFQPGLGQQAPWLTSCNNHRPAGFTSRRLRTECKMSGGPKSAMPVFFGDLPSPSSWTVRIENFPSRRPARCAFQMASCLSLGQWQGQGIMGRTQSSKDFFVVALKSLD